MGSRGAASPAPPKPLAQEVEETAILARMLFRLFAVHKDSLLVIGYTVALWAFSLSTEGMSTIISVAIASLVYAVTTRKVLSGLLILGLFQFPISIPSLPIEGARLTFSNLGLLFYCLFEIGRPRNRKLGPGETRLRSAFLIWMAAVFIVLLISFAGFPNREQIYWMSLVLNGFLAAYVGFNTLVLRGRKPTEESIGHFVLALASVSVLQLFVVPLGVFLKVLDPLNLVEFVQPNPGSSVSLSILFFLALAWVFRTSGQQSVRRFALTGGLLIFAVFLSGSRAVWAASLVLLPCLLWQFARKQELPAEARKILAVMISSGFSITSGLLAQRLLTPDFEYRPLRSRSGEDSVLENVRYGAWADYLSYFQGRPLVGIGFEDVPLISTHSLWIFVLANLGILGAIIIFGPTVFLSWKAIRTGLIGAIEIGALAGMVLIFSFTNWYAFIFPFPWFFAGVFLSHAWEIVWGEDWGKSAK